MWQIHGSCRLNPRWVPWLCSARHLARQVMGMSCSLYFDLSLCAKPHSVPSDSVQHPVLLTLTDGGSLSKMPGLLWEKNPSAQQLRSQAPVDLCVGIYQVDTKKKK